MSEFRILDYNYVFDPVTGLSASSSDPSFPVSNLRSFLRGKVWRSSGTFVVPAGGLYLDFKESGGGAEKHALIAAGSYTPTTLAAAIKAALESAGTVTYTVSYSTATGLWTISTAGAYLSLLNATGVNTATCIAQSIGFDFTTDYTGATSYTGSTIAIHTEEWIQIDLGSPQYIDSVAVIFDVLGGMNLSSVATVTLEANPTPNFSGAGVVFTPMDLRAESEEVYLKFLEDAVKCRYWKIRFIDPSNTDLYLEVAKIFLTKATQLTQLPDLGFAIREQDRSVRDSTPYGHDYFDIYPTRKVIDFSQTDLSIADFRTLRNIFRRVGSVTPICVVLDPLQEVFYEEDFFVYGRFAPELPGTNTFYTYFSTQLTVEEAF